MTYLLALVLLLGAAPQKPAVKYIPAKDVEAAAAKLGTKIIDAGNYSVMSAKRTSAGQAELHDADTDIFYIVDGAATFVTGGKMIDGKVTAPGETRGTKIEGGQTHHLSKGDVITIPKGVPHWFSAVDQPFTYFIVKVR